MRTKLIAVLTLSVFLLSACGGSAGYPVSIPQRAEPLGLHTPTPVPTRVLAITHNPTPARGIGVIDSVGLYPAMMLVGQRFTALAKDTSLFWDATWRAETVAITQAAEVKARELAKVTPAKTGSLIKLAESLRVTSESLANGDLVGLASAARLMDTASAEIRR